jgi:hypothetical protein
MSNGGWLVLMIHIYGVQTSPTSEPSLIKGVSA